MSRTKLDSLSKHAIVETMEEELQRRIDAVVVGYLADNLDALCACEIEKVEHKLDLRFITE